MAYPPFVTGYNLQPGQTHYWFADFWPDDVSLFDVRAYGNAGFETRIEITKHYMLKKYTDEQQLNLEVTNIGGNTIDHYEVLMVNFVSEL